MATLMHNDSRRKYSWWWDSHISPKNSKWLQENLTDIDRNVKAMIKLIEEDADSFARRAEMYYKKRPELMKLVEEFYRAYRALAERYDNATGALRQAHHTMSEAFPNQIPPLLNDESPSSSGSEFRTPEMPSPLQALDSDDLNMDSSGSSPHLHVRRRYIPFSEDIELLPSKRGLKQLKELFPSGEMPNRPNSSEGKVRKGLNFEEGGKFEEIKRLQDQVSGLSSRNENLMAQMALESHRAQTLEEILSKLEAEKEAALLRYKVSVERISTLETNIIHTREDLNKVNDAMVTKLNNVEKQCLIMEKKNQSLQFELEFQQKELEKRGRELEELNNSTEEEHQKMVLAQEEIQSGIEKLKEMELSKAGLEEKIIELREIVNGLHEQNISSDIVIRDLQEEIKSLKETKERLEDESRGYMEENEALLQELCCLKEDQNGFEQMHRGLTEQMEVIAVKNELLENSLLDADSEVKGLQEKLEELEGFCEALVGEVCTGVVEKGVMVSHIKAITQSMESLLKNNTVLENSLSDASAELEGLRAMYKDLEGSCKSISDQNANLLSEKSALVCEVENFESKCLGLQEQQLNLGRANDLALHQIKELENSLKLEKQENEALIMSYASQLASLHDQNYLLQKDIQVKEKNFEVEQLKAINSLFEIFILQRTLCDINDKNLVLYGECQNLLEASGSAENQISLLEQEKFIQKKELALLSEHNEILKEGINVLSEELKIDVKHGTTINATTIESLIQTVLGEVKSLLNAVSDTRDENQHLHLEIVNLENKNLNIQDQHYTLEREKDSLLHKVTELENSSRLEKQEHEAVVLSFSSQFASLQNKIHHLLEEIHVKEEAFEVEQQQNLNALLENFVLRRCLSDMQDGNLILSGEFQTLLEACSCAEQQIGQFRDKELIQKKERSVLRGRILEVLEALNIDAEHGSTDQLKDEVLLQTVLGEIRTLLVSISDSHDENERLHLQLLVVATLLKQIGLDKFLLHHELESRSEELLTLGSKKQELREINEHLNSEKNILISQVVNLESKYLNLQDQHMSLDSEKDSLVRKVMELESSSILEKQEHEALTFSLSSQLASLQNKIHHLQEEIHVREEAFEVEQQSTDSALLENFVLKKSLLDMKDNNVILSGECCSLLEASRCSEQQNFQLKDKELIQMKELSLLSNHIDTVRVGILLLSEALNIDAKHGSVDEYKDEVILQVSLDEIKNLLASVSDAHDENQHLQLEVLVVRTLLNQIGLDKVYLHRELESRCEELLALESKVHELADINVQLSSEKGVIVSQVEFLRHNLEISEKKYSGLESTCVNLENEKSSLLHQVAELACSLRLEKEELEMEQQKNMGSLLQVIILQRCIHDLKDKNLLLSSDCQNLLDAYSCSVKLIAKLEHTRDIKETEMMLLLDKSNKLRDGILLLLKELNINDEFGAIDGYKYEELLQPLHVEIKKILNSLRNFEEESHGRHLQMSVLVTLLKHIGSEREHLYHELERQTEQLLCIQNKMNKAMEINGQLKDQLQRSETAICNLIEENHACLERFNDLKEENAALNEENVGVIFNALKLEHLLIFFENTCAEKTSNLTLLSDDISSLLAVKDGLYEEIKLQNKRMNEMEIEKTTEVAEAQEECAELCRKLEYANRDLDVANMVINELKEKNQFLSSDNASKDEKIMGSTEANGLLVKELETLNCELQVVKRREEYLTSELKKRISEVNESEDEIGRLWSETQYSMLSAAILKERVFELLVACEGLEISAFLQRERCSEEIVSRNAHVDKLKKKLHDLEGERSTLKAELDAYSLLLVSLCDSIASLEEHIFLLTKIQKRQDDESSHTPGNKKSSRTTAKAGFLELQKLIPKVEVLQKMIIDTKTLLKQEKLISPRKDVSKEKYGQITKDIQLDQASRSYKIKNAESDDQMLELWETAAGDDIEAVEDVKSEYPSSELVAEKELSIDKLEVTTRIKESPREWTKRLTEKLDSDARRLSVLQSSLHGLEIKLEHLEKKKLSKNSKYGTQKLQLREAEEDILELVNLNGELKKKVEESFMEKERSHISEEVTGGSEKIGKLELEVQNIEYIILKIEEEEENKRVRYVHRKASILLREYIYTRTDGKWKKRRGPFCGCMRPKTKA